MVNVSSQEDAGKTPVIIIEPPKGLFNLNMCALWNHRELLYFLIWRDIKVRYKQTVFGAGWAIFQPLMTMVIFAIVFGNFAKIPSDGLPYPLFAYTALLPWNYFAQAISRSGASLVANANLISKVYFPRLLVPLSAAVAPLVDFAVAFVVLLVMMAWFGIGPTWYAVTVPFFLLIALVTSLAVGLWLTALNAKFRDIGYTIPFLIQLWMYASPVAYSVSLVPEKWRLLYSLNPMVGVIHGFRWALLKQEAPDCGAMLMSAVMIMALLLSGLVYFERTEQTLADIV